MASSAARPDGVAARARHWRAWGPGGAGPGWREEEARAFLDDWRACLGNDDGNALDRRLLDRRLSWEGMDRDGALRRLTAGGAVPPADWAGILTETAAIARDMAAGGHQSPPGRDPDTPLPFEELWLPFVVWARRRLDGKGLPDALLRDPRGPLRPLLADLARTGAGAAFARFAPHRTERQDVLGAFGIAAAPSRDLYDRFVGDLLAAGLEPLWDAFPVLARLLSGRAAQAVSALSELADRLAADRAAIAAAFPEIQPDDALRSVDTGRSDPHHGGRTVARLTFASGAALIYKPRPVDMEAGWFRFVEWLNGQTPDGADDGALALRAMPVLPRRDGAGDYGWMAVARPEPCPDAAALGRFYRRAGLLLALADLFRAVDLHQENLIAAGEHPVLVDAETLFHPPEPWAEDGEGLERTELLPRPIPPEGGVLVLSGLGGAPAGATHRLEAGWASVNTDQMAPRTVTTPLAPGDNVPRLAGEATVARDHVEEVVAGFLAGHRFFRDRRAELWADDGPVAAAFLGRRGRFVARATRIYDRLLRQGERPENLACGLRRGLLFERLCRRAAAAPEDGGWGALNLAEIDALERGDVPYVLFDTAARTLESDGRPLGPLLRTPPFDQARTRARNIADAFLAGQIAAIRAAFS